MDLNLNLRYLGKLVGGGAGFFLGAAATSLQMNPAGGYKVHAGAGVTALAGYVAGLYTKRPQDG